MDNYYEEMLLTQVSPEEAKTKFDLGSRRKHEGEIVRTVMCG